MCSYPSAASITEISMASSPVRTRDGELLINALKLYRLKATKTIAGNTIRGLYCLIVLESAYSQQIFGLASLYAAQYNVKHDNQWPIDNRLG